MNYAGAQFIDGIMVSDGGVRVETPPPPCGFCSAYLDMLHSIQLAEYQFQAALMSARESMEAAAAIYGGGITAVIPPAALAVPAPPTFHVNHLHHPNLISNFPQQTAHHYGGAYPINGAMPPPIVFHTPTAIRAPPPTQFGVRNSDLDIQSFREQTVMSTQRRPDDENRVERRSHVPNRARLAFPPAPPRPYIGGGIGISPPPSAPPLNHATEHNLHRQQRQTHENRVAERNRARLELVDRLTREMMDEEEESDDDDEDVMGTTRGASDWAIEKLERLEAFLGDDCCAICLEKMSCGRRLIIRLDCEHYFHESCLVPWLRKSNASPLCRSQIPE